MTVDLGAGLRQGQERWMSGPLASWGQGPWCPVSPRLQEGLPPKGGILELGQASLILTPALGRRWAHTPIPR